MRCFVLERTETGMLRLPLRAGKSGSLAGLTLATARRRAPSRAVHCLLDPAGGLHRGEQRLTQVQRHQRQPQWGQSSCVSLGVPMQGG